MGSSAGLRTRRKRRDAPPAEGACTGHCAFGRELATRPDYGGYSRGVVFLQSDNEVFMRRNGIVKSDERMKVHGNTDTRLSSECQSQALPQPTPTFPCLQWGWRTTKPTQHIPSSRCRAAGGRRVSCTLARPSHSSAPYSSPRQAVSTEGTSHEVEHLGSTLQTSPRAR